MSTSSDIKTDPHNSKNPLKTKPKPIIPGELVAQHGEIELNKGKKTIKLRVENLGDRPVQIGSHYHFYEVNDALGFDRQTALGFRLNIPAGTATRFEPGQSRTVELVEYAGLKRVFGFQGRVMGELSGQNK